VEPNPPSIRPDSFEALTADEKAAVRRAELYATHKARGTLGVYYLLYPDERPPDPPRPASHENDGRER
jgi:hypothetical protein